MRKTEAELMILAAETILRNYHNGGNFQYDNYKPEAIAQRVRGRFLARMNWRNFGTTPGKWNIDYRQNNLIPVWWTQELATTFRGPKA